MNCIKTTIIRDQNGREMIRINDRGVVAIARYPDYNQETKEYLVELYVSLTNEDPEKIKNFLNYESEINEFCV